MSETCIPTVDLSPFFVEGDEHGKKKAINTIANACSGVGFFQIDNHGVPLNLMARVLELSKAFFGHPTEEKIKSLPMAGSGSPLPMGYNHWREATSIDRNENLMIYNPSDGPDNTRFNVYPSEPPGFRELVEEITPYLHKTASLLEGILNDSLGLPHNFLKEYNNDRSCDFLTMLHYFPATSETENSGVSEHQDGNIVTFVWQDDVGGLEVLKDGEWIPVTPLEGKIVVNIGDSVQVMSNKRFKSAIHRVVRKERSRFSCCFFYILAGNKWVAPLPHFTEDLGEAPKYEGFFYDDYKEMRMTNKTHPPSRPEDVIDITYYEITG
ncbi:1-aminocyclopropane-1-carboxylate oxidase 5-like [Tasmannia lanceolata]|uniref:1-aminocyclopropane-1-carboxylate oxidase 5-like n=1 Tax=Tasmannia lanceolata TaxID=3420 RepID=UPI004062E849